jgi:hypothetical protein
MVSRLPKVEFQNSGMTFFWPFFAIFLCFFVFFFGTLQLRLIFLLGVGKDFFTLAVKKSAGAFSINKKLPQTFLQEKSCAARRIYLTLFCFLQRKMY